MTSVKKQKQMGKISQKIKTFLHVIYVLAHSICLLCQFMIKNDINEMIKLDQSAKMLTNL